MVSIIAGHSGVADGLQEFLPIVRELENRLLSVINYPNIFVRSYGLMKTACGCLNIESHCVQARRFRLWIHNHKAMFPAQIEAFFVSYVLSSHTTKRQPRDRISKAGPYCLTRLLHVPVPRPAAG